MDLSKAVGERIRELRRLYGGRTQEDVATAARDSGLRDWTRGTVAAIENGHREVTAGELLALPMVLTRAFGKNVPLRELLQVESLELIPGLVLFPAGVDRLLKGRIPRPDVTKTATGSAHSRAGATSRTEGVKSESPEIEIRRDATVAPATIEVTTAFPQAEVRVVPLEESGANREAEQKVAKRLGVDPIDLARLAHRTWGHGFSEERDRRVADRVSGDTSPRSKQAHRGHVTRQLTTELEPHVKDLASKRQLEED